MQAVCHSQQKRAFFQGALTQEKDATSATKLALTTIFHSKSNKGDEQICDMNRLITCQSAMIVLKLKLKGKNYLPRPHFLAKKN